MAKQDSTEKIRIILSNENENASIQECFMNSEVE